MLEVFRLIALKTTACHLQHILYNISFHRCDQDQNVATIMN